MNSTLGAQLATDTVPVKQYSIMAQSFVALFCVYHLLAPRFTTSKQLSWIITTVVSCIMTLTSLPFLWNYLTNNSVQDVAHMPYLAVPANRFFQAYLVCDLITGTVYYRSQISIMTGWFHHILYIIIVEIAIRRSFAHVFCLCCIMEFPTFILGLGSLYPSLRSDVFFALSFFATRIALHIMLCISYYLPNNRLYATSGSFVPAILLTLVFPLHAMWFQACIKGFVRRRTKARSGVALPPSSVQSPVPPPPVITLAHTSHYERVSDPASLRSRLIPHAIRRPYNYYRWRLSQRRLVVRQYWQARTRRVYELLPEKDKVFEYVGLGRG
ncbi:uncharacterized protein BT62DRAFT_482831 [Guyanagaster necrorhizus]|uniref:TLC domain-containing protein n=1 Tax=Guyanagaster necrorhizus TaxID=856835 RepID=A0A9P8AN95_9AGAR|nr:uncharacterized protein BT62DRAFT_482831 [Guyanagaster necrorhizus MCA 3950]KAG7441531.1 hypothetical protein BT62DRAFT_482831 [Guyanagaster necrorhizus MCA 3950]